MSWLAELGLCVSEAWQLDDALVEYAEQPRLLGLIFDELLSFVPHTKALREQLQSRGKVVGALSGTSTAALRRGGE